MFKKIFLLIFVNIMLTSCYVSNPRIMNYKIDDDKNNNVKREYIDEVEEGVKTDLSSPKTKVIPDSEDDTNVKKEMISYFISDLSNRKIFLEQSYKDDNINRYRVYGLYYLYKPFSENPYNVEEELDRINITYPTDFFKESEKSFAVDLKKLESEDIFTESYYYKTFEFVYTYKIEYSNKTGFRYTLELTEKINEFQKLPAKYQNFFEEESVFLINYITSKVDYLEFSKNSLANIHSGYDLYNSSSYYLNAGYHLEDEKIVKIDLNYYMKYPFSEMIIFEEIKKPLLVETKIYLEKGNIDTETITLIEEQIIKFFEGNKINFKTKIGNYVIKGNKVLDTGTFRIPAKIIIEFPK